VHSLLFTPYFSWKSTHRRHHNYTGHMEKDHNYVPLRRDEYLRLLGKRVHQNVEDAPVYVLLRLLLQQALGWPMYLLFSVTSGQKSFQYTKSTTLFQKNHFNPFAALFSQQEVFLIMLSDVGVMLTVWILCYFQKICGFNTVFCMYIQPILWLNQWIVAITYLQHTDPNVPRYDAVSWTFTKGASATIDRDLGFIGRFFFHHVADCHVVHHLFP
jgi:bifunctional Delta-12/omega-3 fatty acid desaturase